MAVWDRVDQPMALPSVVTMEWVQGLDRPALEQLLRSHLLPRTGAAPDRKAWERLWRTFGERASVQNRVLEALSGFLSDVEAHLEVDPHDRRAQRFHEQCSARARALRVAGLDQVLAAVADHRRATLAAGFEPSEADLSLWAVLEER